jgi:hypothetical protein
MSSFNKLPSWFPISYGVPETIAIVILSEPEPTEVITPDKLSVLLQEYNVEINVITSESLINRVIFKIFNVLFFITGSFDFLITS